MATTTASGVPGIRAGEAAGSKVKTGGRPAARGSSRSGSPSW
jgi:hypothetical protein